MFCPYCGKELPQQPRFCPYCGKPVEAGVPESRPNGGVRHDPVSSISFDSVREEIETASFAEGEWRKWAVILAAAALLGTILRTVSVSSMNWIGLMVSIALLVICWLPSDRTPILVLIPPTASILLSTVVMRWETFRFQWGTAFLLRAMGLEWIAFFAFYLLYLLICLDKISNRKAAAIAQICVGAVLTVVGFVGNYRAFGGAYRIGTLLSGAATYAVFCVIAWHLERSRMPGGVWPVPEPAPSDSPVGSVDGYASYPHPYHRLGGFLKAMVIMGYIGAAGIILEGIVSLVAIFQLLSFASSFGVSLGGVGAFSTIIIVAACGAGAVFLFVFLGKIRRKDPSFLRFYHMFCVAMLGLGLVALIVANSLPYSTINAGNYFSLIWAAVIIALYTLYFCKSVRVRTYMGSDEYLRLSPFTRNVPSPIPADRQPYSGQ